MVSELSWPPRCQLPRIPPSLGESTPILRPQNNFRRGRRPLRKTGFILRHECANLSSLRWNKVLCWTLSLRCYPFEIHKGAPTFKIKPPPFELLGGLHNYEIRIYSGQLPGLPSFFGESTSILRQREIMKGGTAPFFFGIICGPRVGRFWIFRDQCRVKVSVVYNSYTIKSWFGRKPYWLLGSWLPLPLTPQRWQGSFRTMKFGFLSVSSLFSPAVLDFVWREKTEKKAWHGWSGIPHILHFIFLFPIMSMTWVLVLFSICWTEFNLFSC